MKGFVDLHLHYVPGVDDGVRTLDHSVELLRGLAQLGFATSVATPHMRSGMFPNEARDLRARFETLSTALAPHASRLPELGLGAEHFVDDVLLDRLTRGEVLAHPGGRAILLELPPQAFPLGIERLFFDVARRGQRVLLAHPERYAPLFDESDRLQDWVDRGVLPVLDLMSLVGRYGRAPERAARRMLAEGLYAAACSDAHGPDDVPRVEKALSRLRDEVDDRTFDRLLRRGPLAALDRPAEH